MTDFSGFYAAYRDQCLRAVLASTGDRHAAEEMVAEAFARAWAAWGKVSRYQAPQAWVVRTALNAGVSSWRKRRREVALDPGQVPEVGTPEDQAGAEQVDAVMEVLARLPQRQREIVALRFFLDLDTATTAKVLGIAPGTVTAHLARAMAALRDELTLAEPREAQS
ncbi:MAG TPA: sigma-70 family RNA polymerase sigma factor [Streptosporangiaceae bacterium]|nr:sigma-70 family RNA polymerase sigma factor [Streptosporangiaceae bacterium]